MPFNALNIFENMEKPNCISYPNYPTYKKVSIKAPILRKNIP
jgi:hypothetical protein